MRPLRPGHCIYCWKVAIAAHVNATILEYRLTKDATSFKNMGRFGPVLVKPGRFGLILVWVDSLFRPLVVSALERFGPISVGCIRE